MRGTRSSPIRSRRPRRNPATRSTATRARAARDTSPRRATRPPGTRIRAIRAMATRAIRNRTLRPTRSRGTASTATPGRPTRPRVSLVRTRTRATAPLATVRRTTPTAAGAGPTRIRIRRPPRTSRPSRRSRTKQIRPRAGNRGGAGGVSRYQPVRLCPRAAPTAFAEYRSAGSALRLSPRGDLRTGQRDEGPAGLPAGPSFCPDAVTRVRPGAAAAAPARLACPTCRPRRSRDPPARAGWDRPRR